MVTVLIYCFIYSRTILYVLEALRCGAYWRAALKTLKSHKLRGCLLKEMRYFHHCKVSYQQYEYCKYLQAELLTKVEDFIRANFSTPKNCYLI